MKKILRLLKEYEEKSGEKYVNIMLYSDGSGNVNTGCDKFIIFNFNSIDELKEILKEYINN